MGVLDFAKGVGDAVKTGLTKVGNTTIDIGKDLGGSGVTLGQGFGYAVDPTHWDNIAKGTGKGIEFVANHPGEAAKIGGHIAKEVAKDSVTTPSGILTTGLALASGGVGLAGKVAQAGKIAKGVEGVSAGAKGVEALGTAAKVSRFDKVLGAGVKVGKGGALERTGFSKLRDPLNYVAKGRTAAAEKILAGAGEEVPSIGRQVMAGLVQGTSGTKPMQLAGISDDVYKAQEAVWRVRQAGARTAAAPTARKALGAAANPRQAVFDAATSPQGKQLAQDVVQSQVQKAAKQFEQPGGQQVMDFGQPKPPGYGGPGYQPQLPLEWPQTTSQGGFKALEQSNTPKSGATTAQTTGGGVARGTSKAPIRGRKTMRAWQGPGREVFGGITPGFDWRDRNWGIERPHRNLSFANGAKTAQENGETTISQGQQPEGSPEPNIKNPYVDEPVDLQQPGTMNMAQFPKTKVVPGAALQSGGSVKFPSGDWRTATPDEKIEAHEGFWDNDDKPFGTIYTNRPPKQPKQQVLGV